MASSVSGGSRERTSSRHTSSATLVFAVVPWKRRKGYATRALELLLPEAKAEGLRYVELTTDVTNLASQRVIEANGGRLIERFNKPAEYGGAASLRFRISLES